MFIHIKNIIKKLFPVFQLIYIFTYPFSASAATLPVHHQYVRHATPSQNDIYNYDMHITWNYDPDTSLMGFYSQFAFWFENGVVGYMGLQTDPQGKKAIFSIWDANTHTLSHAMVPSCTRFGHEGTGTSCIIPFEWQAGREYKLRVWKLRDRSDTGKAQWGGWVIDYATGEETLIGVVEVDNDGDREGYGNLNGSTVATMENYQASALRQYGCADQPSFQVTWFGPISNNGSRHAVQSVPQLQTVVGDPCAQNSNVFASDMWTNVAVVGPGVRKHENDGINLWSHYGQEGIQNLECLFNWFEAQQPESFNQSMFRQRRLSRSYASTYYRDYHANGQGRAIMMDFNTGQVYLGPIGDGRMDIGSFAQWLNQSGCRPY